MSKVKNLHIQLKKLWHKEDKKMREIHQLQVELSALQEKIDYVSEHLSHINSRPLKLSPHAYKRFKERVYGNASLKDAGDVLLTQDLHFLVNLKGDGKYTTKVEDKDVVVVVRDRIVVTLWLKEK